MYLPNLRNYASHGFVVIFPYIKSPQADGSKFPPVTNTNGEYILHGLKYAKLAAANFSNPLSMYLDMENVVIAGHSMGATCSIMAATSLISSDIVNASAIKLVVSQHPGICGPFGPPPSPNTWMKSDLKEVILKSHAVSLSLPSHVG